MQARREEATDVQGLLELMVSRRRGFDTPSSEGVSRKTDKSDSLRIT